MARKCNNLLQLYASRKLNKNYFIKRTAEMAVRFYPFEVYNKKEKDVGFFV